jgi:hypothetical protein
LFSIEPADENIVGAPEWPKIEAEYRAGKSLRAIAAQFGVGKSTISRKAEREGWQTGGTSQEQDAGQAQEKSATTGAVPPVVPSCDDCRDFDWDDHDLVVLHEQPRTALYFNHHRDLVIREQSWGDERFVFITEEYIESFVKKLIDLVGYPPGRKSP